jgi:hypothetical protein
MNTQGRRPPAGDARPQARARDDRARIRGIDDRARAPCSAGRIDIRPRAEARSYNTLS